MGSLKKRLEYAGLASVCLLGATACGSGASDVPGDGGAGHDSAADGRGGQHDAGPGSGSGSSKKDAASTSGSGSGSADGGSGSGSGTGSPDGGSGSGSGSGSADGGSGTGSGTGSGSGSSCTDACTLNATECMANGVVACVAGPAMCTVWGTPKDCGSNATCTSSGGSATCVCSPSPACTADGPVCVAASSELDTCATDATGCLFLASSSTCTTTAQNAVATCSGSACGFACKTNYVATATTCTPPATRPIGPMTGNAVSTRTPTLTWALPTGFTTARVDVCLDAACNNIAWSKVVTGTSATVGNTLPPGMIHWRLTTIDVDGVTPGTNVSPVWELAVLGTHSAPLMTSWPSFADIEGDGFADLIKDDGAAGGRGGNLVELPGSATGIVNVVQSSWSGATGGCGGLQLYAGGDINGDGYSDLVAQDCGGVEVLLGSPTGFPTKPSFTTPYIPGGSILGVTGDFNGDGYADLATTNGTALAVVNGSPTGFPAGVPAPFALPVGIVQGYVRGAGDVNGDGYADLVVTDSNFGGGAGRVWVYLGSAAGLATTPAFTLKVPGGLNLFGYQAVVPLIGGTITADVNGDGWLDLLIPANVGSGGVGGAPMICVYPGSATGFPAAPTSQISIVKALEGVAGGGDVNGDGYGDLIVATSPGGGVNATQTLIFQGSATGLPGTPSQVLDAAAIAAFGTSGAQGLDATALLGDVNGDGLSDFVVAWAGTNGKPGGAAIYQGEPTIPQVPVFTVASGSVFW